MNASKIIDNDCEAIQGAVALALLQLKNAHGLTYEKLGKACEREKQSIQQYVCGTTEMTASCWLKLVATWPELRDRVEYNLDEAEKAFRAKQRSLDLDLPMQIQPKETTFEKLQRIARELNEIRCEKAEAA